MNLYDRQMLGRQERRREKEREKEEKTVLQANLYRAYGVIVPLVISDNNSDKEIRDNEKQDEDISTESGDALSR